MFFKCFIFFSEMFFSISGLVPERARQVATDDAEAGGQIRRQMLRI